MGENTFIYFLRLFAGVQQRFFWWLMRIHSQSASGKPWARCGAVYRSCLRPLEWMNQFAIEAVWCRPLQLLA